MKAPRKDFTVFKPMAEHFSFKLDCDIRKRGYYPRGGGEILVRVSPVKYLKPITLTDRGSVTKIYGRAFVAGVLPYKKTNLMISRHSTHMVKDMISAAVRCIRRELRDLYVNIQGVQETGDKAVGNGSGIIYIHLLSFQKLILVRNWHNVYPQIASVQKLQKSFSETSVMGAALMNIYRISMAPAQTIVSHLIIFMALADGVSRIKTGPLTLHTQTAIHFVELLTKAKFTVTKCDEPGTDNFIIECQGVGLQNKNYYTAFYGRTKSQHAAFVTVLRKKYANESLWKREKYGLHTDKQCDLREIRRAVREKIRFHTTNAFKYGKLNIAFKAGVNIRLCHGCYDLFVVKMPPGDLVQPICMSAPPLQEQDMPQITGYGAHSAIYYVAKFEGVAWITSNNKMVTLRAYLQHYRML
ncbi:unnamed protein product [Ranitomeya imitator]|uniref:RNA 3'-terminal phosphate cyclase n=1 Tax=Ranitomeya imitator TaxID=111125 RepID=A0ABN9MHR2_9NEOB|nr:unnamed protein product [Ranitomeya imitator]